MNDTVYKLMNFLAKRDGTFQYVSKLANWRVEATHPFLVRFFHGFCNGERLSWWKDAVVGWKHHRKRTHFFIYDFWRFCLVRKVDEVEKMKNTRSFESRKVRWGWRNSWRPVVRERFRLCLDWWYEMEWDGMEWNNLMFHCLDCH